jgi:hypothetical protein
MILAILIFSCYFFQPASSVKMCSVAEDSADLPERASKSAFQPGEKQCQKCRDKMSVIRLRGKDVYCEQFFITAMSHKFRSTLGKNKAMRLGDR